MLFFLGLPNMRFKRQ